MVGDGDSHAGSHVVHHRSHASAGRVAIVHAGTESLSGLATQLSSTYDVVEITVGRTLIDQLLAISPDVVVIEHSPGDFDVTRVCRDLNENLSSRIVVLSGDDSSGAEASEIALLDSGADDFMSTSISADLLSARLRLALRGRSTAALRRAPLTVGDVIIDRDAHTLYIAGEPKQCSRLQFLLLVKLAVEVNRVVDADTLLRSVWRTEPESVHPRRLRVAISLLRGVLGSGVERPRIETVPHVGYRLVVDHPDHGTAA